MFERVYHRCNILVFVFVNRNLTFFCGGHTVFDQRHLTQQHAFRAGCQPRTPAARKDVAWFAAMAADKLTHVFDDTQNSDVYLFEHGDSTTSVEQRHRLWGRDNDSSVCLYQLRERQLCVTGTRRQIDNKIVELTPVHVVQELLDRLAEHWAAPDDWLVVVDQEREAHEFQSIFFYRCNAVVFHVDLLPARKPEHLADRRPINICIHKAYLFAHLLQR